MEQARSTSRGQGAFSAVIMGWFTQVEKTYKKYLTKSRPPSQQAKPSQPKTPNGLQTHHYPIFREKGFWLQPSAVVVKSTTYLVTTKITNKPELSGGR
jgi:hypothetical protein